MKDYIVKAVAADGNIRAYCATTKNMVNEAQRIHDTYPVATAALGRTLTAAAIMGSMLKGDQESITIQIKGEGPLGGVTAVTNSKCELKGYVHHPHIELGLNAKGKLDVGGAIGEGKLTVVKDLGLKEPYVGHIPLTTGEIGDDITKYFWVSEQIPSAVGLGVLVDVDGSVLASGGFIIQLMPTADEQTAAMLEETIKNIHSVTDMLYNNMTPEDILKTVLSGFDVSMLETVETSYHCDCNRERIERALISLGAKELTEIIEEDGKAELVCHFCSKKYLFEKMELEELNAKTRANKK